MRLFFALWPDDSVRQALFDWARACRRECGGRLVRAENLHATLAFVGDVHADRYHALTRIGAGIDAHACELILDRIEYWPHNRIVYAGSCAEPVAAIEVARILAARLAQAGFKAETRRFVAHVTLLRDALRAPAIAVPASRLSWRARDVALVESRREGGRLVYRVRERCRERWTLHP